MVFFGIESRNDHRDAVGFSNSKRESCLAFRLIERSRVDAGRYDLDLARGNAGLFSKYAGPFVTNRDDSVT